MAAAVTAGAFHRAAGEECQDYAATLRGARASVIALADGAGSAECSAIGARLAVRASLALLDAQFHELCQLDAATARGRVLEHVRRALDRYADVHGIQTPSLASTLLFVATDGALFVAGQIGDGRVAVLDRQRGSLQSLFEPTRGEYSNQTVFTTSPSAPDYFSWRVGRAAPVAGFALLSDGPEEALYDRAKAEFAPAVACMLGWLSMYSERQVRRALAENLAKVLVETTHDDLGIALLGLLEEPTLGKTDPAH